MEPEFMAAPLILAGVLVASGVAKLRQPEDAAAWEELGVPAVLRRGWLIRLHPWGEGLLAAALLALGGVLGALASACAVILFGAYLLLVTRRLAAGADASCTCFGAREPITAVTVVRNAWFLLLAVFATAVTWSTPLLGGPLAALGDQWSWLVGIAAGAFTVALVLWHPASVASALDAGVPTIGGRNTQGAEGAAGSDADPAEYIRTRTPAVPVTLADGSTVNLRQLAARGPMLLLAVKEDCGACRPVIEATPGWRELLPEVSVRFLLWPAPENSALTELTEPQSLHDPYFYVQGSIADWATPTAVLIGADGYLAGGPVSGFDEVSEFVGDIYESLHGVRPQH
ncbi:MauE/DoxX family redox-associated membrane protein [Microbacterium murale]|uniref:Methylamine utilisation protein MauE domain-containing protein n=1 Tax=Microbacterium murale TaxID=1081040 RepID=A0ABU0PB85_9MICO|nr:MauE/DoxX family redox-associated membrane protein [Microbacterium murale]MDQ0644613.1 hypothetical protein [Microbacterium murale]